MKRVILFFLAGTLLAGCLGVPTITRYDLMRLEKGMQQSEAAGILRSEPRTSLSIRVDRQRVTTDVYRLSSGQYYSDYFLSYDAAGKLVFWGYPHEFARSKSSFVNNIGRKSLEALKAQAKK